VKPNDLIYLDDGKMILLVSECDMSRVKCEVKAGGLLGSYKNVKLPSGKQEHIPVLTSQDQDDLITLIQKQKCDYLAVPYAVRKRDIVQVKDVLGGTGAHIQILAKIDTVESIHNFEELIKAADGVIINRIELGLEMHAEKLVLAQKWMVDRCC
jgi:pyruvate kinase